MEQTRMELWGGVECTINRVGDRWGDQCRVTGHEARLSDIDLLADLELAAIRYPLLWERVSPDRPDACDWSWLDPRLVRLRERGVRVIAGLVHHGSGPHYTDLLDSNFAPGLARHARAVAERFPWIEDWTPVNEPITTARFSALYGLWYPHRRDEGAFWLAVLNQIDAVRLAMREVRRINPVARLIQTDDLGRTYATAPLRQQAAFDNMRRWAGWDLLCGAVTPHHPLFARIGRFGLADRLRAIADDPCRPDMIGVNHYLTSDRFLDHRTQRYPGQRAGGNGRDRYIDVEAIRVLDPAPQGLAGALGEAWHRYHIPIAVTEVHNGCTREEQMRWMAQAWAHCVALESGGIDIRAVTSWALLGGSGWNTLLTAPGRYEPGAFHVGGETPRPTALAAQLRSLARGGAVDVAGRGWWERPIRFVYPPVCRPVAVQPALPSAVSPPAQPILICGAGGTLGKALARACCHRDLPFVLTGRRELALDDATSIDRALDRHRPWAVINAAGWVRVDDAEADEQACFSTNAVGALALAQACAVRGIRTVSFSSDLVFDGVLDRPYHEQDMPAPLNAYGRSKRTAEQLIGGLSGVHLVIRTAAFFSPFDQHNFAWAVVDALGRGERFRAVADQIVSPTYVPHLADAVLDLAIDGAQGIWHLSNGTPVSWSDFAIAIAGACGFDARSIEPVAGDHLGLPARRPVMSALSSGRGTLLPPLEDAIRAFAHDRTLARSLVRAA